MTRALQFFQPAMNDSEDSDSDLETGTSPKLAQENIVITEKKMLHQVCVHKFYECNFYYSKWFKTGNNSPS